jgi:hypothetical protein
VRAGLSDVAVRTSARMAFITWIAGGDIRREGRVTSFDGAVPLRRLARGLAAQVAEAVELRVRRHAGEEIVLTARAPAPLLEEARWDVASVPA